MREFGGYRALAPDSLDTIEPGRVAELWRKHSEKITSEFGLQPAAVPQKILVVPDSEHLPTHGYSREGNSLVLAKKTAQRGLPLEGIVASEVLRSATDDLPVCNQAKIDFAMEYAREVLTGVDEEQWSSWWAEMYPRRRVTPTLLHYPVRQYTRLYRKAGGAGLRIILGLARQVSKTQESLDLADYVRLLHIKSLEISSPLNTTELSIVRELTRQSNMSPKDVAEKTGYSTQWVSKKMRDMKKRGVLREFQHIRFSKVGIRMFNVLLGSRRSEIDPLALVESCPFLYGYRRVLTGRWNIHAIMTVPDSIYSIRAIEQLPAYARKWDVLVDISEVSKSGTEFAFDYYDSDAGVWRVPWRAIQERVSRLVDGSLQVNPVKLEPAEPAIKYQLDKLDIEIMDAIRRGLPSIAAIRKDVQAGQNRVARKVQKLHELGVVATRWEVHNVGLIEGVIVRTDKTEFNSEILTWVRCFPRSITSIDTKGELFVSSYLPVGGAHGAIKTAERFGPEVSVDVVGNYVYGGWGFPADLWDKDRQLWSSPRDRVKDWIESLR